MMKTTGLVVILVILLLGFGCSRNVSVKIASDPAGTAVKATADKNGPKDFLIGTTPLTHKFTFSGSGPTMYNLEFTKAGYDPKTISLNEKTIKPELSVVLEREVVREIEKYVVELTEDQGYVIRTKRVRAWIQDIEREGMAASIIVKLNDNQSIMGMAMSADGQTLYFSLAEAVLDAANKDKVMANIRAISAAGSGITQITSGLWLDTNPSCTSDGRYIVFNSNRFKVDKPDLFRIATDKNSGISVIRQTPEGASYEVSALDANFYVYTYKPMYGGRLSPSEQIWTIGGDNGYPTQLRNGRMPSISPEGKEIAFIGDDNQLWKMPVTGQNPVQLTNDTININGKQNPVWTPDSKYIVYSSDGGKDDRDVPNYDIWMIASNGGAPLQLTTNGSEDGYPIVSPDQKYIYFVSNRGFKEGIWRIPFPAVTENLRY